MGIEAARLYVINECLLRACRRGWWVALAVRLAVDLELSAAQLVLLGTAMELTILVAEVPTGVVADLYSRKWSIVVGLVVIGSAQVGAGLVEGFALLVATQVLWGFGWTFLSGATVAWVTDELGSVAVAEALILRTARLTFVATIVGLVASGLIGHFLSLQVSIVGAGALLLAWGLAMAVVMREDGFAGGGHGGMSASMAGFRAVLGRGADVVRSSHGLRLLMGLTLMASLAAEVIDRLDVRRLDDLGLSSEVSAIGVFAAISVAEACIGAIFLWRTEARLRGEAVVPAVAALFAAIALTTLAVAHVEMLGVVALVMVLQGSLMDVSDPLRTTWTNVFTTSSTRATVHSFVGQVLALGEIVGGVALGVAAGIFTVSIAMTVSAVLFAAAGAIAVRARGSFPATASEPRG